MDVLLSDANRKLTNGYICNWWATSSKTWGRDRRKGLLTQRRWHYYDNLTMIFMASFRNAGIVIGQEDDMDDMSSFRSCITKIAVIITASAIRYKLCWFASEFGSKYVHSDSSVPPNCCNVVVSALWLKVAADDWKDLKRLTDSRLINITLRKLI